MDKILIIAEAGVNHNGDLDIAYRLVDEAVKAGADIVKFQTGIPEKVISKFAEKAEYQKVTTGSSESQLDMVRKLMLPFDDFRLLKKYCEEKNISFLSTPFDLSSVDFLEELGCDMWKIPSGEITNYPYLVKIAKTGKDILLSTGMSTLEEVRAAYDILKKEGAKKITLLHCTTEYPAPVEEVNLRAMQTLASEFGCDSGYSDHTEGIEIPIAAVAMGAKVIEKHFTLDKNMEGPDHKASLEPDELSAMVKGIRKVEKALGNGIKAPSPAEEKNRAVARKSIVAAKDIKAGDVLNEDNLTVKRPGNGISPMEWNNVIGTKAVRDFKEDELISL